MATDPEVIDIVDMEGGEEVAVPVATGAGVDDNQGGYVRLHDYEASMWRNSTKVAYAGK
jgi:hypothetical protein